MADIQTILQTMVDVEYKQNNKWYSAQIPLFKVLQKVDSEVHDYYKCYAPGNKLSKEQKMAITRKSCSLRPGISCLVAMKQLTDKNQTFGSTVQYTPHYLRWIVKIMKSNDLAYQMENNGSQQYKLEDGFWEKYRFNHTDNELILAELRNRVKSCTTSASSLTDGHNNDSDVYKINDLGSISFDDWVRFFVSRPGYAEWKNDVVSRPDRLTVKLHIDPRPDGLYYVSDAYFA